jgi:hypothetical protein
VIFGSHSAASAGVLAQRGTAANVMVTGQPWPASTWVCRYSCAARATCAPGRGSVHGVACRPCSIDVSISGDTRVVAHHVHAPAEAVVGVQLGRVAVGQHAELEVVGAAGERAEGDQCLMRPAGALALDRLRSALSCS